MNQSQEAQQAIEAQLVMAGSGFLGHSEALRGVMQDVTRAAGSAGGVLIVGEPGSGREAVARAVHLLSHPSGTPFVGVSGRAPDPVRLELELFGTADPGRNEGESRSSEREAVTRESVLWQARGGTLYLTGAENLPSRVQARMAHVLRDGEVRVDGREIEPLVLRPMAGLDDRSQEAVEDGRVRPDLAMRLMDSQIAVPPLRRRAEDIPTIAAYYLGQAAREMKVPARTLEPHAVTLLTALPWKENTKELRTLMEILALGSGRTIGLGELLEHVRLDTAGVVPARAPQTGLTLRQARRHFERDYISSVLTVNRWRIADAARTLGIQRTNLYRKLRALKLTVPPGTRTD